MFVLEDDALNDVVDRRLKVSRALRLAEETQAETPGGKGHVTYNKLLHLLRKPWNRPKIS